MREAASSHWRAGAVGKGWDELAALSSRSCKTRARAWSVRCWNGWVKSWNHWRLRGNVFGVEERGWTCAGSGVSSCSALAHWFFLASAHAWETSLPYCLRILRFSCGSLGGRAFSGGGVGVVKHVHWGGLTASTRGSPMRSLIGWADSGAVVGEGTVHRWYPVMVGGVLEWMCSTRVALSLTRAASLPRS